MFKDRIATLAFTSENLLRPCVINSFYHALESNDLGAPQDGIRFYVESLSKIYPDYSADDIRRELETWFDSDDDINTLIQKKYGGIDELLDWTLSKSDQLATKPESPSFDEIRREYSSAIFAVQSNDGAPAGTSFLVSFLDQPYIVTCAHVIDAINKKKGELLSVRHFNSSGPSLQARVIWLSVPSETMPVDWTATQDVAVLRLEGSPVESAIPLTLADTTKNPHLLKNSGCWCFGYVESARVRGAFIQDISCQTLLSNGFVQLFQSSSDPARIESGASGAPLHYVQGNQGIVLGMVQGILVGRDVAYLIPANVIQTVLEACQNEGR
jgi:S1-C subfamily serine protease